MGIAGVDGNGQSELVEAITGLKAIESGSITFNGETFTHLSIRERNEAGLGHIPEDRQKRGLIMGSSISDNMVIKEYYRTPFSKWGVLDQKKIDLHAQEICDAFDVRSGEGIFSHAGNSLVGISKSNCRERNGFGTRFNHCSSANTRIRCWSY